MPASARGRADQGAAADILEDLAGVSRVSLIGR